MSLLSKPTGFTNLYWATGASALVAEPTATKKTFGWGVNEQPPSQFDNWFKKAVVDYLKYSDSIQSAILGGTVSMVGAVFDGTGATGCTSVHGALTLGGTAIMAASPMPNVAPAINTIYRDMIPIAAVRFTYSGGTGGTFTIRRSLNLKTNFTRNSAGQYECALNVTLPNVANVIMFAGLNNTTAPTCMVYASVDGSTPTNLFVMTTDGSFTPIDVGTSVDISVIIYAA